MHKTPNNTTRKGPTHPSQSTPHSPLETRKAGSIGSHQKRICPAVSAPKLLTV